jgi:dipeptidyl aminopeptidase/acylaminoacyl peptidase
MRIPAENHTFIKSLQTVRLFLLFLLGIFLFCEKSLAAEVTPLSFGGDRHDFTIERGRKAFVILPKGSAAEPKTKRPWIWYAPTFVPGGPPGPELDLLFGQLLQAGFGIAGVDVGESYGSPEGREAYSRLYAHVTKKFRFAPKACLLPQSRGGLMLYNWAAENPKKVECIGGIYTVCNIASYPGIDKAAPAYKMTPQELTANLLKNNPFDRLTPLFKAKVPIFHIHGDVDKIVPLEKNAGELVKRYRELGGSAELVIVHGKGHEVCPEFFHSQALLDFFLSHDGKGAKPK